MCLAANQEKRLGFPPPLRTVAYKCVQKDRRPVWQADSGVSYDDGAEVAVDPAGIEASRLQWGGGYDEALEYFVGLHVFTDLGKAMRERDYGEIIIEVEVSPDDWIAEDTRRCEAVYCRLKVIGELK